MATLFSSSRQTTGRKAKPPREIGNQGSPDMGNSGPFRGELASNRGLDNLQVAR